MHGIIFGHFCPMYLGHRKIIDIARRDCDNVSVVVCGYPGDNPIPGLDVVTRAHLVAQEMQTVYNLFGKIPETLSFDLVEQGIEDNRTYNNWCKFADAIVNSCHIFSQPVVFYVDQPEYVKPLLSIRYQAKDMSRHVPKVEARLLRDNPTGYFDLLVPTFAEYYRHHQLNGLGEV